MNDRLENKRTMYKAVIDLLDANTTKTSSMTAFATALNSFKDKVVSIGEKNQLKDTAATGKTTLKSQLAAELIAATVPVAGALFAYGSSVNDPRITELGDVRKTDLEGLRDTELTDKVMIIKNLADANAAQLAAFGVEVADIAALDTKSSAYDNASGDKETGFSTQESAGKVMTGYFKDADGILEDQLDRMMEKFNSADHQFYLEYKSAREIIDLGRRIEEPETPINPTP
jgi:hypothetical protein